MFFFFFLLCQPCAVTSSFIKVNGGTWKSAKKTETTIVNENDNSVGTKMKNKCHILFELALVLAVFVEEKNYD